eukprot:14300750-Alexandrium_andersonii.AAC.1
MRDTLQENAGQASLDVIKTLVENLLAALAPPERASQSTDTGRRARQDSPDGREPKVPRKEVGKEPMIVG